MGKELALRTLSGILLLIVVTICSLTGGFMLLGFAMIVSILGYLEYHRMISQKGIIVERWAGIAGVLLVVAGMSSYIPYRWMPEFFLFSYISFLFLFELKHKDIGKVVGGFIRTAVGVIYLGWMLGHLVRIEGIEGIGGKGALWTIYVTGGCDTGCYMIGKAFGRGKLIPRISRGKTIEGALGGILFGVVIGVAFQRMLISSIPIHIAAILGAAISILGQIGDLCESMVKRYCEVKDSGSLIPGHGGVLDRADSLIFSSPISYYLFLLVSGI